MKIKSVVILFLSLMSSVAALAQIINIHSVTYQRQSYLNNEYTLDGAFFYYPRQKLMNPANFGISGTYRKSISIHDGYVTSNSLDSIVDIPHESIFLFGAFDRFNSSLIPFTNREIDSLHSWSKKGGKLIICGSASIPGNSMFPTYQPDILNSKWGFHVFLNEPSSYIPTPIGSSTEIFNGPFGSIDSAMQGGGAQGYFDQYPVNSVILAKNPQNKPTIIMDCSTLDLILADVDGFTTNAGSLSYTSTIDNNQDIFWANTIAFMDRLQQPPPPLTFSAGQFSINASYPYYQWYLNGNPISGGYDDSVYMPLADGNYYLEVTVNGGCKSHTDTLTISSGHVVVHNPGNGSNNTSSGNTGNSGGSGTTNNGNTGAGGNNNNSGNNGGTSGSAINPVVIFEPDTLIIPNIFTPNNDGTNDGFNPLKSIGYTIKSISIYNRWGELVREEESPVLLWDGTIKGEKAPDGAYFWHIYCEKTNKHKKVITGFVHLIR